MWGHSRAVSCPLDQSSTLSARRLLMACVACASLLTLLKSATQGQATPTVPGEISITASPTVVQPTNGKLPSSLNLAIFANDCEKTNADLTKYSLQLTGTGLSLTQPATGKCTITAKMNIDQNAPSGQYKILLLDQNGKPSGRADFAV